MSIDIHIHSNKIVANVYMLWADGIWLGLGIEKKVHKLCCLLQFDGFFVGISISSSTCVTIKKIRRHFAKCRQVFLYTKLCVLLLTTNTIQQ